MWESVSDRAKNRRCIAITVVCGLLAALFISAVIVLMVKIAQGEVNDDYQNTHSPYVVGLANVSNTSSTSGNISSTSTKVSGRYPVGFWVFGTNDFGTNDSNQSSDGDDTNNNFYSTSKNMVSMLKTCIDNSNKSIRMAMYKFSATSVYEAIENRMKHNDDLKLFLYLDSTENSSPKKPAQKLLDAFGSDRVDIRLSNGKAHTKIIIFDETVLWIGSSNLSDSGLYSNVETVAIIQDDTIVKKALEDQKRLMTGQPSAQPTQITK